MFFEVSPHNLWSGLGAITCFRMNKTRKMVLDFRKEEDSSTAGTHPVNVVEECRYLGFYIDNRLYTRMRRASLVSSKINGCSKVMKTFYH